MDFRTCPACEASVLEDDATECPFCGASMTTGKGGKPRTPAAAPTEKPAAATKKAAGKPAQAGRQKAQPDSADPFEVDTSSVHKAVRVRPRPAKGVMTRVVCPMCERPGFISEKDVGKEVRCCNPECLVPIFVAQAPEKEPEPEPEPEKSGNPRFLAYSALGIGTAIAIAAALIYINRKPEVNTGPSPDLTGILGQDDEEDPQTDQPQTTQQQNVLSYPRLTPDQLQTQSLARATEAAEYASGVRDRSFSHRLLAESLMVANQPTQAHTQLDKIPRQAGYLAIPALVIEAWQQLDAGQQPQTTIERAVELAKSLPNEGRDRLDSAGALASVLVAVGNVDEAVQLAQTHNDPALGRLSTVWRAAVESGDYDFHRWGTHPSLQDMPQPQWITVTQTLAIHRRWDEALTWIERAPDLAVRDNAQAALAAALTQAHLDGDSAAAERLESLTQAASGAGLVRLKAAVAWALHHAGKAAEAAAELQLAEAALNDLPRSESVPVPEMKALYQLADQNDRGLPDTTQQISAVLAAADVAEVRALRNEHDQMINAIRAGIELLEGTAPSPQTMAAMVRENSDRTRSVRDRLQRELDLQQTQVFAAFSRYQAQVNAWNEAARKRLAQGERLLKRAAIAGSPLPVWEIVKAPESGYLDSTIPPLLSMIARTEGLQDLEKEIRDANPKQTSPTLTDYTLVLLTRWKPGSDANPLLKALQNFYRQPPTDRARVDVAFLDRLENVGIDGNIVNFLSQLPDPLIREDALWSVAARATVQGNGPKLFHEFNPRNRKETDRVAIYRGFVAGAQILKQKAAATPSTAAEGTGD